MIEANNWGVSMIPRQYAKPIIVDQDGKFVGYISYNGKIWACEGNKMPPIYDPYKTTEYTI